MRSKQLGVKIKTALLNTPDDAGGRWSQARLSRLHGINKDVMSRFLRGKTGLPDETITAIAKTLDASFEIDTKGIHYIINPTGSNKY